MFTHGEFRFLIATSPEQIRELQQLRYRIYVEECGFERAEDHPEGREADPFDDCSVHLMAVDASGRAVGTTRLVLNSGAGLPIHHVLTEETDVPRHSTRVAEVSRLAVDPMFRRKTAPLGVPGGVRQFVGPGMENSRRSRSQSVITTGLIYLLLVASVRLGLTHWVMISEEKLWVMLKRLGIVFRPIGEAVEYHGRRIPYLASLTHVEQAILDFRRTILCPPPEATPAEPVAG
jgi:N-acyl amino acid synthase of PEP-CTERM/exosortase system